MDLSFVNDSTQVFVNNWNQSLRQKKNKKTKNKYGNVIIFHIFADVCGRTIDY
jgi:hypothetical protein